RRPVILDVSNEPKLRCPIGTKACQVKSRNDRLPVCWENIALQFSRERLSQFCECRSRRVPREEFDDPPLHRYPLTVWAYLSQSEIPKTRPPLGDREDLGALRISLVTDRDASIRSKHNEGIHASAK